MPAQACRGVTFAFTCNKRQPGYHSRYSDSLWAGRFGARIPVKARYFAPVKMVPEVHPVSCTRGVGVNHSPASRVEIKERVDLYSYSAPGPSWHVIGRNFLYFTANVLSYTASAASKCALLQKLYKLFIYSSDSFLKFSLTACLNVFWQIKLKMRMRKNCLGCNIRGASRK